MQKKFLVLAGVVLASILLGLFLVTQRGNLFDSRVEVTKVWQNARDAGGYGFRSDIIERAIPLAQTSNVGRTSTTYNYHLEGTANFTAHTFDMSLWDQGGSVLDPKTATQVKIENDKTLARRGDQEWQDVGNATGSFAPQGDFLAFLAGAKNIVNNGSETRNGISFVRYTFEIDGTGFATFVRDQLQAQKRADGELPYGLTLDLPAAYENMTGEGELWVRADGLPLREIITAHFPPPSATADYRRDAILRLTFLTTPLSKIPVRLLHRQAS